MSRSARIHKSTLLSDASNKTVNHSSQEQHTQGANLPVQTERRTRADIREPVTSIEHAMDIALGDEGKPCIEKRRAA
jgi:hypothetical protein